MIKSLLVKALSKLKEDKDDKHNVSHVHEEKKIPRKVKFDDVIDTHVPVIVTFKSDLAGSPHKACAKLKSEHDIHPHFIYHSSIKGFASKIHKDKLDYLENHPNVEKVEIDHSLHHWPKKRSKRKHEKDHHVDRTPATQDKTEKTETEIDDWNLRQVLQRPFKVVSKTFLPVSLYILDTGLSRFHKDVHCLPQHKKNFTNNVEQDRENDHASLKVKNKETVVENMSIDDDMSGHGTHISGIATGLSVHKLSNPLGSRGLIGVGPGLELHPLQVLDKNGDARMSNVMMAIEYVVQEKLNNPYKPIVMNLSLGFDCETTEYNALDMAVERAIELGIVVVVAAGNDGKNADTYSPAHVKRAITVSAYDRHKNFAKFSNWGESVDILAPGVDIYSAWKNDRYKIMSGTSMSAPHVSAAAALYLLLNPIATSDEVKYFILNCGQKNVIGNVPKGTANVALFLNEAFISQVENYITEYNST